MTNNPLGPNPIYPEQAEDPSAGVRHEAILAQLTSWLDAGDLGRLPALLGSSKLHF